MQASKLPKHTIKKLHSKRRRARTSPDAGDKRKTKTTWTHVFILQADHKTKTGQRNRAYLFVGGLSPRQSTRSNARRSPRHLPHGRLRSHSLGQPGIGFGLCSTLVQLLHQGCCVSICFCILGGDIQQRTYRCRCVLQHGFAIARHVEMLYWLSAVQRPRSRWRSHHIWSAEGLYWSSEGWCRGPPKPNRVSSRSVKPTRKSERVCGSRARCACRRGTRRVCAIRLVIVIAPSIRGLHFRQDDLRLCRR
mmetsp:Transcript_49683/g.126277  ORF Transcript_49683/g.126277 Transcript_49683/m.126277 type:complete len:249 (-) Transcript_49683:46-792(-)